jgi:hypothetical protein
MFTPRNLLLSLALSAFAASASAGSLVYVENGFEFGTVDLASGAFTPVGPGTPEGLPTRLQVNYVRVTRG